MFKCFRLKNIIFWIVIIILILNAKNITRVFYPIKYQTLICESSKKHNVSPYLISAIIKTESNFNPNAASSKGARGLMQITGPTAEWIADTLKNPSLSEDFLVPENNIEMGCYYISYLLDMYNGNEKCALAAYNAGFNVVNRWLSDPTLSSDGVNLDKIPYRETELYVTKVQTSMQIYDILYDME